MQDKYKPLNINILDKKDSEIISTDEALKDAIPFDWNINKDGDKNKGNSDTNTTTKRYCAVEESLEQSLIQMKLMREEKLPKKSLKDIFENIREENSR